MRAYSASSEETLRARSLLKDWFGEGFLTKAQYDHLQQETISDLRTTNIFLRMVLFFFALIGVGAAAALFSTVFLSHPSQQTIGVVSLIFAAAGYGAAEFAVSQARLYRYGIEEALAACSVVFLCAGIQFAFFTDSSSKSEPIILAAGAIFSLWIWRRFGLWYAFLAAMILAIFLPGYWTSSHPAQHVIVAAFYAIGIACVIPLRSNHRFDYLNDTYSLVEALLWLGIYLAFNLKLSSLDFSRQRWVGGIGFTSEFPRPFYWTTFVLIWLLPAMALARGIRQKDRLVIAVGAITAILTFITNKPYLGWPRHTWDPMILGFLLTGVALYIRHWLAQGPNGIRHGFTAMRLSGKDKQWMNAGSAVLGLITPQAVTPAPQATPAPFRFGGGASGGGGATGDY